MATKTDIVDDEMVAAMYDLDKKKYFSWVSYDIANTFYASGILTLVIANWILIVGQNNGFTYATSFSIFNATLSTASVFMAILLPVLGAISDIKQDRKSFVVLFSSMCVLSTAVFAYSSNFWVVLIFFAISMISYQWAQMFYDSMLPGVVPPGKEARLSSIAIALGYLGGLLITLYSYIISQTGEQPVSNPENGTITFGYLPLLIPPIIIGFIIFMLPITRVKETDWSKLTKIVELTEDGELSEEDIEEIETEEPSIMAAAKGAFGELLETFRDIKANNIGMFYYIIAYFIIADLANLIVLITTLYLRDVLVMPEDEVFYVLGTTGAGLIFLSYFVGQICDRWGAKRGFQSISVLWISALTIFMLEGIVLPRFTIYIAALLIGPALSGVWISQRQMVLELVPDENSLGRYFGLTKFSGKLSSAAGPFIFGSVFYLFNTIWGQTNASSFRFSILVLNNLSHFWFHHFTKRSSQ